MTKIHALKTTRHIAYAIVRAILLLEISYIVLYPLLYIISIAFRPAAQVEDPNIVWIPTQFTLENVISVWNFIDYPKALFNTFYLDAISVVIQTAVCCMVGYGFARFPIRFKNILFAIVIFTIIVPPSTTVISSFLQYRNFDAFYIISTIKFIFTGDFSGVNILDTPLVLYLPSMFGMGIRSGLFIFIFRQFFRNVAKELEEAAYIDGCGAFRCFLKIMVPIARPAILTTFLFSSVWYWNDTFYSTVFLDNVKTVSSSLQYLSDNLSLLSPLGAAIDRFQSVTLIQAGCFLTVIPLVIMYAFLQKFFTESIEKTGIVG
ncbi:MAG: carbohydrate ABC transporter permease [Ruminococcaceae bacterium]|nr:carbohydrate ABC transporter permease [Oscillospiraceae bacterium]